MDSFSGVRGPRDEGGRRRRDRENSQIFESACVDRRAPKHPLHGIRALTIPFGRAACIPDNAIIRVRVSLPPSLLRPLCRFFLYLFASSQTHRQIRGAPDGGSGFLTYAAESRFRARDLEH